MSLRESDEKTSLRESDKKMPLQTFADNVVSGSEEPSNDEGQEASSVPGKNFVVVFLALAILIIAFGYWCGHERETHEVRLEHVEPRSFAELTSLQNNKDKSAAIETHEPVEPHSFVELSSEENRKFAPSETAIVVVSAQECLGPIDSKVATLQPEELQTLDFAAVSKREERMEKKSPISAEQWREKLKTFVHNLRIAGHRIVLTREKHPEDHVSFSPKGVHQANEVALVCNDNALENNQPELFSKKVSPDNALACLAYVLDKWQSHCVKSKSARFLDGLCEAAGGTEDPHLDHRCTSANEGVKIIEVGTNKYFESYNAVADIRQRETGLLWQGFSDDEIRAAQEAASWGLTEWLTSKNIQRVAVIGIADDFAVMHTANALAKLSQFKVVQLPELSFGVFKSNIGVLKAPHDRPKGYDEKVKFQSVATFTTQTVVAQHQRK